MNLVTIRSGILLFSMILLLLVGACGDDTPTTTTPTTSPLVGTWIFNTSGGLDITPWQYSYTFTSTQATLTGVEGCRTVANYTVSGNRLMATNVSDECHNSPAGTIDTVIHVVTGSQLLLIQGTDTARLTKGTPSPVYSIGNWRVDSIDGSALQSGESQTLAITRTSMTITHGGNTSCVESFDIARDFPGYMSVTRTADACHSKPLDETLLSTYEITGTKMTLVIEDVTYIATRI
jgi:hypothetical protein